MFHMSESKGKKPSTVGASIIKGLGTALAVNVTPGKPPGCSVANLSIARRWPELTHNRVAGRFAINFREHPEAMGRSEHRHFQT